MTDLQAAWLGSWRHPWDLGRGRRWGDAPWALAAISRAWLLGGRCNQWPQTTWQTSRPLGPSPSLPLQGQTHRPDPTWIALLRHGSARISPRQRGQRETELRAWCWEALLDGDAEPWLSSGSVLLDLSTRQTWIPLIAAVDAGGKLQLPSYLYQLIPEALLQLPQGWWPCLLGSMDREGHLLPEGDPPDLPWSQLRSWLEPLTLATPPPVELEPWAIQTGPFWVIDPRIRAWTRGWGAHSEAISSLNPAALSLGAPPDPDLAAILAGHTPSLAPDWTQAIQADLEERPFHLPEASLNPVLDRIRSRWGGELPAQTCGYPAWGEIAHPCADPFHWMAEGRRAYMAQDFQGALRAFTWAHAHFQRLGSSFWAERTASNASLAAQYWGDSEALQAWQHPHTPSPSILKAQADAILLATQDEWGKALPKLQELAHTHNLMAAWATLTQHAMLNGDRSALREYLPHLETGELKALAEAFIEGMKAPPSPDLGPEMRLLWQLHRVLQAHQEPPIFWEAWESCSNQPLRLGTALHLLEARPGEQTLARLLKLQALAERNGAPRLLERLRGLWPSLETEPLPHPETLLQNTLMRMHRPTWILWGTNQVLGVGTAPPAGAMARLREAGSLPPIEVEGLVWRGFPLVWQHTNVALALVASMPEDPLEPYPELSVLAPWLSLMSQTQASVEVSEACPLITDGSEPMGRVLQELAQVAPTRLPVLILGPTGSGKELTAREIHRRSGRTGALLPINVSALAESLLETELFGHVKGAFTGADRERKGAIESAEGGTLFLDEVADLSPRLQSMLLRVLQEREVKRVGCDLSRKVDVRFVAATHKPLADLVAHGAFRQDLFFRLQGAVLELPSLQQRRHEFPFLVPRLVAQVAREAGLPEPTIAVDLPLALSRLPWPGNIRELRHALQRALLRCGSEPLQACHFPELQTSLTCERTWERATQEFQRNLLLNTLRSHSFQVTETAQHLGISRPALYQAARRLGVDLVAERSRDFQVD